MGSIDDDTRRIGEAWAQATALSSDGQLQQAIVGFLRLRWGYVLLLLLSIHFIYSYRLWSGTYGEEILVLGCRVPSSVHCESPQSSRRSLLLGRDLFFVLPI